MSKSCCYLAVLLFTTFYLNAAPGKEVRSLRASSMIFVRSDTSDSDVIVPHEAMDHKVVVCSRAYTSETDLQERRATKGQKEEGLWVDCSLPRGYKAVEFTSDPARERAALRLKGVLSDCCISSPSSQEIDSDSEDDDLMDAISYLKSGKFRALPEFVAHMELLGKLKSLVDAVYSDSYEPNYNASRSDPEYFLEYLGNVEALLDEVLYLQRFFGAEHFFAKYLDDLEQDLQVIAEEVGGKI